MPTSTTSVVHSDHQRKSTDNGTEFKNKLWSEVFNKLRTEQKFTPIYSPQCNGRIEGFHKFLKATIAKQQENYVEWDDLVWKATSSPWNHQVQHHSS